MGDHVHTWTTEYQRNAANPLIVICLICHKVMPWLEVHRRLNATERLSANSAEHEAKEHDRMSDDFRASLFAYALALEKK